MHFRQVTRDDLACASSLIGGEQAGVAAGVDPGFEIDAYLELGHHRGVRIEHELESRNHADHRSTLLVVDVLTLNGPPRR